MKKCSSVPNARDLHGAANHLMIKPGRVYRSSNPASASGEPLDLFPGVACLVDLRSKEEMEEDPPSGWFDTCTLRIYGRTWRSEAVMVDSLPPKNVGSNHGNNGMIRHNISLLERSRFYIALLRAIPFLSTLWAVFTFLFRGGGAAARKILVKHVNQGGLGLLYKILIVSARPEINRALTVVLESLESQQSVLIFCKAGKDRTGLIVALILSAIGCDEESILNDYCLSNNADMKLVAMAGIEKKRELDGIDRSKFEGAPREALKEALDFIKQKHGSVTGYLCGIGFDADKQWRLRSALDNK